MFLFSLAVLNNRKSNRYLIVDLLGKINFPGKLEKEKY